jgi:hypothetical protein
VNSDHQPHGCFSGFTEREQYTPEDIDARKPHEV